MNILPIEVHASFKTQGIASAQTNRGDTGTVQVFKVSRGLIGRKQNLQAIFSGIACARDKPVTTALPFEGF